MIIVIFEHSNATSNIRVKGCADSDINLLKLEDLFTIQNILKFAKLLCNIIVPEKFKRSPILPIKRSAMFLFSTTSILSCKR